VATDRPNIIFLMSDQQRWNALGCVNPMVQTPALDSLAAEGIRYEQAVCQNPICVPSRYSMMLGLYPSQIGVRNNCDSLTDEQLPVPTLAQRLQDEGYLTAGFGKTHWRDHGCSTRGFEVRTVEDHRDAKNFEKGALMMGDDNPDGWAAYKKEAEPYGVGGQKFEGYVGCTSDVPEEDHPDGWTTEQCLKFLDGKKDDSRPLFLYFSLNKPHVGLNVPRGYEDQYDINDIPDMDLPHLPEDLPGHLRKPGSNSAAFAAASEETRKRIVLRYWASCTWIDTLYGKVLDRLRDVGALENALIVFVSDHGDMMGDRYFRHAKCCLYEGSIRVPMILSGNAIPESMRGTVDQRPAELVDVIPTILEAAGIARSSDLVGEDLLGASTRKGSFAELHYAPPSYMWRTEKAKLILYSFRVKGGGRDCAGELYDLEADPGERVDQYDNPDYAALRESMTRELLMRIFEASRQYPHRSETHTNPMTD
jgi:arylsulfatase